MWIILLVGRTHHDEVLLWLPSWLKVPSWKVRRVLFCFFVCLFVCFFLFVCFLVVFVFCFFGLMNVHLIVVLLLYNKPIKSTCKVTQVLASGYTFTCSFLAV